MQFYDFEGLDSEWKGLASATEERYAWQDKKESAYFRGSCWFYKNHGRTAAISMSKAAPDMVDAAWYEEIRTDMLEKDGVPQFGDIEQAVSACFASSLVGGGCLAFPRPCSGVVVRP